MLVSKCAWLILNVGGVLLSVTLIGLSIELSVNTHVGYWALFIASIMAYGIALTNILRAFWCEKRRM